MPFTFTLNGNTYTSDPANSSVPDGYRFIGYGYITALGNLGADIAASVATILGYKNAANTSMTQAASWAQISSDKAVEAAGSADQAAASAALAATVLKGTSSSSIVMGGATSSLVTQPGRQFGTSICIARASAPATRIFATVTSYDSVTGALAFTQDVVEGSGTYTDWTITTAGARGAVGPQGSTLLQGTASGAINWNGAVTIASASGTFAADFAGAASNDVIVTGTTAITALGTAPAGAFRWVQFAAAGLVLTNGAALALIGNADITTEVGDIARFKSLGGGNWAMCLYQRKSGSALFGGGGAVEVTSAIDITLTKASERVQSITFSVANKRVKLPDATTMQKGEDPFVISLPAASKSAMLTDSAGNNLQVLTPGQTFLARVVSNTIAAGKWMVRQETGITAVQATTPASIGSGAQYQTDGVKGFTKLSDTFGIVAISWTPGTKIRVYPVNISPTGEYSLAGAALDISAPTNTHNIRKVSACRVTDTCAAITWANSDNNGVQGCVVDWNGAALTAGAAGGFTGLGSYYEPTDIVSPNSGQFVVVARETTNNGNPNYIMLFNVNAGTRATTGATYQNLAGLWNLEPVLAVMSATEVATLHANNSDGYMTGWLVGASALTSGSVVGLGNGSMYNYGTRNILLKIAPGKYLSYNNRYAGNQGAMAVITGTAYNNLARQSTTTPNESTATGSGDFAFAVTADNQVATLRRSTSGNFARVGKLTVSGNTPTLDFSSETQLSTALPTNTNFVNYGQYSNMVFMFAHPSTNLPSLACIFESQSV